MSRFKPWWMSSWSKRLALKTSWTSYLDPITCSLVFTPTELPPWASCLNTSRNTIQQKLKTVIAGFNDNRSNPQQFADDLKCPLDTIYMNFNPSTVILTKTILSVYQPHINKKLFAVNNALQFLLFKFYPSVVTIGFDNIYDFTFFFSLEMVTYLFLWQSVIFLIASFLDL